MDYLKIEFPTNMILKSKDDVEYWKEKLQQCQDSAKNKGLDNKATIEIVCNSGLSPTKDLRDNKDLQMGGAYFHGLGQTIHEILTMKSTRNLGTIVVHFPDIWDRSHVYAKSGILAIGIGAAIRKSLCATSFPKLTTLSLQLPTFGEVVNFTGVESDFYSTSFQHNLGCLQRLSLFVEDTFKGDVDGSYTTGVLALIISSAKQVHYLSLHFTSRAINLGNLMVDSCHKLSELCICHGRIDGSYLIRLFQGVSSTLRHIFLSDVRFFNGGWANVFEAMECCDALEWFRFERIAYDSDHPLRIARLCWGVDPGGVGMRYARQLIHTMQTEHYEDVLWALRLQRKVDENRSRRKDIDPWGTGDGFLNLQKHLTEEFSRTGSLTGLCECLKGDELWR